MESVIITVKIPEVSETIDLEIPADASVKSVIDMVGETFNLQKAYDGSFYPYTVKAELSGKSLKNSETLLKSGVSDGEILTFVRNQ